MPRTLIIGILVLLIIGIGGGTVVLLVQRFGLTGASNTNRDSQEKAQLSDSQLLDPTADPDGDGLSNADEKVWGTSASNPDTDGDSFKDGEEVRNGHNPSVAAPNDVLPPGFVPGKDVEPTLSQATSLSQLATVTIDPAAVSQQTSLTAQYLRQYPEGQRTPQTLAQFVNAQPITTELPALTASDLSYTPTTTREGREYYRALLQAPYLSVPHLLSPPVIADLYTNNSVDGVQSALSLVTSSMIDVRSHVPPDARELHQLVVAYAKLLSNTLGKITRWNEDRVGALVALRQLNALHAKYYSVIQQQASDLPATAP